jgi:hypothetical protein
VKLEVGGHEGSGEFGIGCGTSTRAPNVWRDVVQLLTVLEDEKSTVRQYLQMIQRRKKLALSATMGPLVARVSAAMTTPPSNRHPTMVVPVLVAFGRGTPFACKATFLLWLLKSKPPMMG